MTKESQNEEGRIDLEKYEGLIDVEGYIDYDGLDYLLAEVKRLTAMFEETNHHLDLMVGAFGIEPLVEMVGEEEE